MRSGPAIVKRVLGIVGVAALVAAGGARSDSLQAGVAAMEKGDVAEAYYYWRVLAEEGDAEAQYRIGWLYANGDGLNLDMHEAVHWWERAAGNNHADAQFALGLAFLHGEGVRKDSAEAAHWLVEAARTGHEDAQDSLRRMAGEGVAGVESSVLGLLKDDWRILGGAHPVRSSVANLRAAPGLRSKVIMRLPQGQVVIELKRESDWLNVGVTQSGVKGWIHRAQLE